MSGFKKIFSFLIVSSLLSFICYFSIQPQFASAGIISLATVSADATPGGINANFQTLQSVVNGNIQGSGTTGSSTNILADSLGELDMADEINPRVRANELLNIGADSVSAGNLTQTAVVESGGVPADDTDLTSDISACVAYINGYRISKGATALTYTASRDNYVDLSQAGVYTVTAVTNGATQPSVAANSVRLAKVVTDGTEITTITSLYTTRIPGLVIPSNYRDGLFVSRDSATAVTVQPGSCEINNTMLSKSAITTLTLTTGGDWAGGSSLAAANTFGYVGIDTSGNIKLHTTAPTHDNYSVSTAVGKKRFATWSGTVYRILGWFRMNASSQLDTYTVGNIREGNIPNSIQSSDTSIVTTTSTTTVQLPGMSVLFYSSGGPVLFEYNGAMSSSVTNGVAYVALSVDSGVVGPIASGGTAGGLSNPDPISLPISWQETYSQGTHTFDVKWRQAGGTATQNGDRWKRFIKVTEL